MGAVAPWVLALAGLGCALAVHGPGLTVGESDVVTVLRHADTARPTVNAPGATTLWLPALTRAQSLRPATRAVSFRARARLRDGVRMELNPVRLRYRLRGEDIPALAEYAGSLAPEAWDAAATAEASRLITAALAQVPDALTWTQDTQAKLSDLEREATRALVRIGYRVDGFDWPPAVAPGGIAERLSALAALAGESAALERRAEAAKALVAQRGEAARLARTAFRQQQIVEQRHFFETQFAEVSAKRDAATLRDVARLEEARQRLASQRILAPALVATGVIRAESAALRAMALGADGHRVVRLEGAHRAPRQRRPEACPVAAPLGRSDTETACTSAATAADVKPNGANRSSTSVPATPAFMPPTVSGAAP